MTERDTASGEIQSLDRSFDIIEYLDTETSAGITEIASAVKLAKSTVHDHLTTLRNRGYVVRTEKGYQLGMEFLHLGESARQRLDAYPMAGKKVEKLAEQTDERSQFIIEENGYGIYVYRETGRNAVQTDSAIGGHIPLHATAAGKALLSQYADDHVREVLASTGLPPITKHTITDEAELLEELERTRERGYAVNKSENTNGLRAVGAPVRFPDGSLIGAISISGPTHRMKDDRFTRDIPNLLLGTVNELELNIAYA